MGNNLDGGFQQLPRVYLRDLRRKTEKRFRSVQKEHEGKSDQNKKKQQGSNGAQLNGRNVSEFIIRNPEFLDDLVKKHIAQDRIRAWIREPTDEESADPEATETAMADDQRAADQKDKHEESTSESTHGEDSGSKSTKESSEADDSNADSSSEQQEAEGGKNAQPARRNTIQSRGDSTFEEYMARKGDRYQKLLAVNRSRLVYPFKYSSGELNELIEASHADVSFGEIESHLFPYTEISTDEINKAFIQMSGILLGKYGFPMTQLCYFLSTMRANYLSVEYHNYSHAISHAQSMFWILRGNPGVFTELEMKALLIACIAHDVGHPGVNEAFLKNVHSGMQKMYDDPILENHHTQTCLLILQEIKCNVFCDLDTKDYKQVLDDIKHAILSTDVKTYRVHCERVRQIMDVGVNMDRHSDRQCVKSLMMMACDLCSAWKRWDEHRSAVWSLYKEFFNQGDKETEFGLETPAPFKRTNADNIPTYQISFMESTVLPVCQLLAKVFPSFNSAVKTTKDNLECWKTYG